MYDDKKQQSSKDISPNGYQSYTNDYDNPPPSTQDSALEKVIERDMSIEEYKEDRDVILMTIKNAIKEKRFDEAQAFVHKYRAAAKIDENFAVLAKMTAQGMENNKKIEKLVTILDATPDDDYPARIAVCKRILDVQPDNVQYRQELKRCEDAINGTHAEEKTTAPVRQGSPSYVTAGILTTLNVCLMFAYFSDQTELSVQTQTNAYNPAPIIAFLLTSIGSCFLLTNRLSPMFQWNRAARILVNVGLWIAYTSILVQLWPL